VEPMMVGIFGAGMTTIRRSNGSHHAVNNYATAPAAATPDMYRTVSDQWPDYQLVKDRENDLGVLAVGVPGTLKGWCETLERHGRLSLEDVLQPAIRHAERGFRATVYLHEIVRTCAEDLAGFPETARTFLPENQPIRPGAIVRQPEYAQTLKTIAQAGPDALYDGELGRLAVDYIQAQGGLITNQDLAGYRTRHTDVVSGEYRGYEIFGPAPPSAGGIHLIEMLNLLEPYDIGALGFGTPESIHLQAEILKLAFEDRGRFTGDPDFVDVPVGRLISRSYADERRTLIDETRARITDTTFHRESAHTTHLTTADADGNIVAATHTIHSAFGSKATVPGTGMLLNNTMNIFDPHPGLANSILPGKRMTSSMAPTIVEQQGAPAFALGSVGGTRIFPSVFQAIVNVIDHQMSAQEAVEAPRIWTQGENLETENAIGEKVLKRLAELGHRVSPMKIIGAGMGMIQFEENRMTGASCWRADGTPIGIGGGLARPGLRFDV